MTDPADADPSLYHQAFSWRDTEAEAETMRALWAEFGRGPLCRVLDLACGSAPHARALDARGYRYLGLDLSAAMLSAADAPAAGLMRAEIAHPPLAPAAIDLALVMLGSLYLADDAALDAHLATMATLVRPGGGYLLDWCVLFDPVEQHRSEWMVDTPQGRVRASYRCRWHELERELIEERLIITQRGRLFEQRIVSLALTADRFARAVAQAPGWDLAGCWEDWDLERPIAYGTVGAERPLLWLRRV